MPGSPGQRQVLAGVPGACSLVSTAETGVQGAVHVAHGAGLVLGGRDDSEQARVVGLVFDMEGGRGTQLRVRSRCVDGYGRLTMEARPNRLCANLGCARMLWAPRNAQLARHARPGIDAGACAAGAARAVAQRRVCARARGGERDGGQASERHTTPC